MERQVLLCCGWERETRVRVAARQVSLHPDHFSGVGCVQIFKGTYGKSRPNPNKERKMKRFGLKPTEPGPVPVPEPPAEFATPKSFAPEMEGVVWDLSDRPFNNVH